MRERTDKATANHISVFEKVVKSIEDNLQVGGWLGGWLGGWVAGWLAGWLRPGQELKERVGSRGLELGSG
jgi:hypothetical protein